MPTTTTKACPGCKETKSIGEFHKNKNRKDGHSQYCRPCANERVRRWQAENREEFRAQKRRAYQKRKHVERNGRIRRAYGMTPRQYQMLFAVQKGMCAICGRKESIALSVDHDHATGSIRGLLCRACNLMLGNSREDPNVLELGAMYLLKHTRAVPKVS